MPPPTNRVANLDERKTPWRQRLQAMWPGLRRWGTIILLVAIAVALGQYCARHWQTVITYHWENINWAWVGPSLAVMCVFWLGIIGGWRGQMELTGLHLAWPDSLWTWSRSSLARYLPTPVWATGSRIYLTMQLGASWQSGAFGYAAELTASVAAAFSVTLLALPSWTSASVPEAVWLTGLAAVAVLPGVYWLICRILNRKFCPSKTASGGRSTCRGCTCGTSSVTARRISVYCKGWA